VNEGIKRERETKKERKKEEKLREKRKLGNEGFTTTRVYNYCGREISIVEPKPILV